MRSAPKISVLMPVYNTKEEYLRKAVKSILQQTYADFELVICDDGSDLTDVKRIIESFNDPRIRYFRNQGNRGISESHNKLVELARGEFYALMDHDDISHPNRLLKQLEFLESHPDFGLCGTAYKKFGKVARISVAYPPMEDALIRSLLFFKCPLHHPTVMIRKELFSSGARYDPRFMSLNDRKLFFDLASKTKFANLSHVLYSYRFHPEMTTQINREKIAKERRVFRQEYLKALGVAFKDEDIKLIDNYLTKGNCRIKDPNILVHMEKILDQLCKANDVKQLAPTEEFKKICAHYLVRRCLNGALWGWIGTSKLIDSTDLPVKLSKSYNLLKSINKLLSKVSGENV